MSFFILFILNRKCCDYRPLPLHSPLSSVSTQWFGRNSVRERGEREGSTFRKGLIRKAGQSGGYEGKASSCLFLCAVFLRKGFYYVVFVCLAELCCHNSLCRPGQFWTPRDLLFSASQMVILKECATGPGWNYFFVRLL